MPTASPRSFSPSTRQSEPCTPLPFSMNVCCDRPRGKIDGIGAPPCSIAAASCLASGKRLGEAACRARSAAAGRTRISRSAPRRSARRHGDGARSSTMLSRLVRGVEGNGAWAERSAISVACREGQPRRNALVFTEVAGEAGFDDLAALTQVRLPKRAKLGLARNYWDEMGRGNAKGMHGPMLETLSTAMALRPKAEETVWESLALAN